MTARPRVLVGLADAWAAVETAWSLRDAGFDVVVVNPAGNRSPVHRVRDVRFVDVTPPRTNAERCLQDLAAFVATWSPAAVVPFDDDMVWLAGRLAGSTGVPVVPSGALPDVALDKRVQVALAAQAGLRVPPTVVVDGAADWPDPIDLPVIVKGALATETDGTRLGRQQAMICRDAAQWRAARATMHPPLLVQPLVHGVGEGVFGLATDDGVVGWSGHRRIRMMNPAGSGASASRSVAVDDEVRLAVSRFVQAAGWRGMFMVELLREPAGARWFMELNGRAWGSMALARRRGFAYPAWTVQQALGTALQPPVPSAPPDLTCRHVGREIVHVAFVARGSKTGTDPSWPRTGRTLREVASVHAGDEYYNWRAREWPVFAADTWQTLANQVRRAAGRR